MDLLRCELLYRGTKNVGTFLERRAAAPLVFMPGIGSCNPMKPALFAQSLLTSAVVSVTLFFWVTNVRAAEPVRPPVVIAGVGSNSTTSRFGDGYLTRGADGTTYQTSKFGSGWITRSSDGKTYTTSSFGNGSITRGPNGETVTTTPFGSGLISRSSDGTTATTSRFGSGIQTRSSVGQSTTTSPFGSGYISRGQAGSKDKGSVLVLPQPKQLGR
jgi:hypothetical protein